MIDFEEYHRLFVACGGTDRPYLEKHFKRYANTRDKLLSHWDRSQGNRLLDIGAHWLHQSLLYAIDGFEVTAVDLPVTFEMESVRAIAQKYNISLIANADLEQAEAFKRFPDDSFDRVLFTEIMEHIAFNPVAMWREIYRVTKPGGRIVITTPNYYSWRSRVLAVRRLLSGFGGGVSVLDIIKKHTYAHHWKEYSLRELIYYFSVLSPDFKCVVAEHAGEHESGALAKPATKFLLFLERKFPVLMPDLYMEVEISGKEKGITVEPGW